jgi:hypothetical protein
VTRYTVAVGPRLPGRQDCIVALIADTKEASVFRRASDDQDVLRIAAEVGVRANRIQWDTGFWDGGEVDPAR